MFILRSFSRAGPRAEVPMCLTGAKKLRPGVQQGCGVPLTPASAAPPASRSESGLAKLPGQRRPHSAKSQAPLLPLGLQTPRSLREDGMTCRRTLGTKAKMQWPMCSLLGQCFWLLSSQLKQAASKPALHHVLTLPLFSMPHGDCFNTESHPNIPPKSSK